MRKMSDNRSAVASMTILIVLGLVAAGAGSFYVIEDQKARHVTPDHVLDKDVNRNVNPGYVPPSINREDISDNGVRERIRLYLCNNSEFTKYHACIDKLNIEVYRLSGDGVTVSNVSEKYMDMITNDGYKIIFDESRAGAGWSGRIIVSTSILHAKGMIAVEGNAVTALFGCDVLLITSFGLISDYYECKELIMKHCASC